MRTGHPYPYDALDRIWRRVLLHQFHDILPGSSIAWVHRESRATYPRALAELEQLVLDKNRYYAPLLVPNAVYGVTDGIPLNANPFNPILVAWK